MREDSLASPSSTQSLHIWIDYPSHTTDFSKMPDLVRGCFFLTQTIAESLKRNLYSDLVTELEAIGDRLSWIVDSQRHAFNSMLFDSGCESFSGEVVNSQRWYIFGRSAHRTINSHPDFERLLSS